MRIACGSSGVFDQASSCLADTSAATFAMLHTLKTSPVSMNIKVAAVIAVSLGTALSVGPSQALAQKPAAKGSTPGVPALTAPLPVDPKVRVGTLPNGIKYYIRQNPKPEKRAELRLVVNAGSVLENNEQ